MTTPATTPADGKLTLTGDEVRAILRAARNRSGPSDPTSGVDYVAATLEYLNRRATPSPAQATPVDGELLPCPFCGGPVYLERASDTYSEIHGTRKWWGVICRNTENLGGSCAIWQNPSASKEAAIERWNRRATPSPGKADAEDAAQKQRVE